MSRTVTSAYPFAAHTAASASKIRLRWFSTTTARGSPWRPRGSRLPRPVGWSGWVDIVAPVPVRPLTGARAVGDQAGPRGGPGGAVGCAQDHVHDRRQKSL